MNPSSTPTTALPAITDAHRRAAFREFAWLGWTFKQAMANHTRRTCIEARAFYLRNVELLASQTHVVRPPEQITTRHH